MEMKKRVLFGFEMHSIQEIDRIIEMAWEDRTPFNAILLQFGTSENDVINIMRKELKPSSFKCWRKRVKGRKTKHSALVLVSTTRFKCSRQRAISANRISKR